MVAKFRDKCRTSEQTLHELTQKLRAGELDEHVTSFDVAVGNQLVLLNNGDVISPSDSKDTTPPMHIKANYKDAIATKTFDTQFENEDQQHMDDVKYIIVEDNSTESIVDEAELFSRIIDENAANDDKNDVDYDHAVQKLLSPIITMPPSPAIIQTADVDDYDDDEIYVNLDTLIHDYGTARPMATKFVKLVKGVGLNHYCSICGAGFMHMCNLRKHMRSHRKATNGSNDENNGIFTAIADEADDADEMGNGIDIYDQNHDSDANEERVMEEQYCTNNDNNHPIVGANDITSVGDSQHRNQHHAYDDQIPPISPCLSESISQRYCNDNVSPDEDSVITPSSPRLSITNTQKLHEYRKTSRPQVHRRHQCPHCERTFNTVSMLNIHVRVHTGERPFVCEHCPKAFATRSGLDLHVRRHLGVKPYACPVCDRRFVENSNLRVHMRTHTGEKPHRCSLCDRSFARVFLLQIHQRTHTGERPYSCDVCQRAFSQAGDLAAHRRIHTGERPHQCTVCGRGFIKSSALTSHMRMHAHAERSC